MDVYAHHPQLPLYISNEEIFDDLGNLVGHLNCGDQYLYVVSYSSYLVVCEVDTFESELIDEVQAQIEDLYYYVFRILCSGGVTAVVAWDGDVDLVGRQAGRDSTGGKIVTKGNNIIWCFT